MSRTAAIPSVWREVIEMTPTSASVLHRILLVDDDDDVRSVMEATLQSRGFEVSTAEGVVEALKLITTESFDVLITDLHMPHAGDGFTLVTAMRHSQPDALTLVVSGFPDVQSAMAAILLEADEIMVKPFEFDRLAELVREKMRVRKPAARMEKTTVGRVLERNSAVIIHGWLERVKQAPELNHLALSDQERTGHLPKLVEDLVHRLDRRIGTSKDSDAVPSGAAVAHGKLRHLQGYSPAMLVHESRILQVTLFGTLQNNMHDLDFSILLPDVMTIADEVDAQLTQSMDSFMKSMQESAAA
ncbi:MAG TPA: response regulator [Terriglobales bacterium]|jgi:DNA-binding response OmpR family regulator|nr:response regulator [Terriglobales bacterium]